MSRLTSAISGLMRYAVWPDGTVFEAPMLFEPPHYMSDDFALVYADSEEEALDKVEAGVRLPH